MADYLDNRKGLTNACVMVNPPRKRVLKEKIGEDAQKNHSGLAAGAEAARWL